MSSPVISVEHLSKAYRLGQISTGTFTNDLKVWWARARGKPNPLLKIGTTTSPPSPLPGEEGGRGEVDTIWALKDVSFTVEQGEVLGIIGRNGAGKSTLLKILSRVTAPTYGKVKVKGRVASLLEVGTGFHPELTGRENIYLNGAILGMSKAEVTRKFDEIVDFSGVEQFIDTPVKRYSSGMYVRLAFAVAAHLDPEILLVDEVLAVGDAQFQEKCLGKMGDVAREGRTVLFVSHNLVAIRSLCTKALLFEEGRIRTKGAPVDVIDSYILPSNTTVNSIVTEIPDNLSREGDGRVRFIRFSAYSCHDGVRILPTIGSLVRMEINYVAKQGINIGSMLVAINICDAYSQTITSLGNRYTGEPLTSLPQNGTIVCEIPRLPLMPGRYSVNLVCRVNDIVADKVYEATVLTIKGELYGTHALPHHARTIVVLDHSIYAQANSSEDIGGIEYGNQV